MLKRIIWTLFAVAVLSPLSSLAAADKHAAKSVAQPATIAQSATQADAEQVGGFPVTFFDTEIFSVKTSPIGSLTPEKRARLIEQNIRIFADGSTEAGLLKIIKRPEGLGIGTENNQLMIITDSDAALAGKTADELAGDVLEKLQLALRGYRTQHNWQTYGLGAALTLLSIFGLWLTLHWINKAFAWLLIKVISMKNFWSEGVHFRSIKVLSVWQIQHMIRLGLRLLRFTIILLCWYLFLLLTLSFFPETRKLGSKIFDYLLLPFATIFHTVISYIPNLFFIFVIGVVAFYILQLIAYVFELIERGELKFDWFYVDWARPTYQIIRFLVIVTALISAYPYIPGSSSQAFQGVGLVLGAIISFASSSAISNIVAGIILTYTRAFKLEDRVKVGETIGDVVEKTLLVTRIKTIKHVVVTIPNSLVMGSQIINYSTSAEESEGVIMHTSVTIGYEVSWQKVEELLIAAAIATEKIIEQPAPFVLQTSLDDSYVSYEINASTKEPEHMAVIYSDLHRNIQEKFNAAGVEIMSPSYYALRDGNSSTIPGAAGDLGNDAAGFKFRKG